MPKDATPDPVPAIGRAEEVAPPPPAATNIPLVVQVGFAGSRRLFDPAQHPRVDAHAFAAAVEKELESELASLPGRLELGAGYFLCGISQIAAGADMIFARACAKRGIPHRLFLPLTRDTYLAAADEDGVPDFTVNQRDVALAHLDQANIIQERVVSDSMSRTERFTDTNIEIVRVSDVIICLFRADAAAAPGGTRDMMGRALARGRPVLEIQVEVGLLGQPVFQKQWHHATPFPVPTVPMELQSLDMRGCHTEAACCFTTLYDLARTLATRKRWFFQMAACLIVSAHVLATACAVYAVTFHPPRALLLFFAEALLLGSGFWLHYHLGASKTARVWSMARLVEQVAVSLKAMGGVNAYPAYLFALPIPESLRALRRTLCVLHLRATHRCDPATWSARRDTYLRERLSGPEGQLAYYTQQAGTAHRDLHRAHLIFYAATLIAILATLGKAALALHVIALPEALHHIAWPGLALAAILLPVVAVAALSLAASFDLEAKAHTYSEQVIYLRRRQLLLAQASTEREFNALALDVEAHLLGEATTWYARRAYTGVN